MGALSNLQPASVFFYFEKICNIPHGSGNVSGLVEYCIEFVEQHGLTLYRDEADNLIIRKKGSPGYENADVMILQGHTDMVCEKEAGKMFDFTKDAIEPYVDGDWIRARGTTLGGDNGIAVAMCLALLDDNTLEHPPLEILLTADEETGMLGAFALDCSQLTGNMLINLDSEYEGVLMCSCAGGANMYTRIPVAREEKTVQLITLEISGLKGGHSGVEIDKGRANSNVLITRLLNELTKKCDYRLVSLSGGSRETVIAYKTMAVIGVMPEEKENIISAVKENGVHFRKEYATVEPDMIVSACEGVVTDMNVLTDESTKKIVQALLSLPDGVKVMSRDMPGLVQTSANFGLLELHEKELYFSNTVRSAMTSQKQWVMDQIKSIAMLAGGRTKVAENYPGWSYNSQSVLKNTFLKVYKELFGKDATVDAVHAGIECGLFADSIKNLDCISVGPEMADVHTPRERFSISSVNRTYELLCEVLKQSKK